MKWYRVTRKQPCRVCQKPDWCTFDDNGAACCMRVESDRPMRNGGWLHRGEGDRRLEYVPLPKPEPIQRLPWSAMLANWARLTDTEQLIVFADRLGVSAMALRILGCAWAGEHRAWAFPMRNGGGVVVGIRLRNWQGDKWAVKHSKQGLFYSLTPLAGTLYICEGPTDTAAGLTLGLQTVGRPSCRGCLDALKRLIERFSPAGIVVIADRDSAGQDGAFTLQETLSVRSIVWTPPAKDLREFVRLGGTRELIEAETRNLQWKEPTPCT